MDIPFDESRFKANGPGIIVKANGMVYEGILKDGKK